MRKEGEREGGALCLWEVVADEDASDASYGAMRRCRLSGAGFSVRIAEIFGRGRTRWLVHQHGPPVRARGHPDTRPAGTRCGACGPVAEHSGPGSLELADPALFRR
nr:hypothetical protein StreXyl84_61660 [Streptomyces sp. Xyl84]